MKVTRLEAHTPYNPDYISVQWELISDVDGVVARGVVPLAGPDKLHVLGEWPNGIEATSLHVMTGALGPGQSLEVVAKSVSSVVGKVSFGEIERYGVQEMTVELVQPKRSFMPLLVGGLALVGIIQVIRRKH